MSNKKNKVEKEILDTLNREEEISKINFTLKDLKSISPLTQNQAKTFNYYDNGFNLILHGVAGTGKTFLAYYKALTDVLDPSKPEYEKIIFVRSAVQTRSIGFMPGTEEEKNEVYEKPYAAMSDELFNYKSKNYINLKSKGIVEFMSTSFIRGITLNNSIIIVDEAENLNFHELKSIVTRIGKDSKIIFCGDYAQTDLSNSGKDCTGILKFMEIARLMKSVRTVKFNKEDIVRSGFVREFIEAELEYEENNK